ncbi:uncharacterized protein LOC123718575 isoform X1 [Pieris brassicae]|uniref:uncharacterized protein LOC123718575 isoform X1 n=1 Tax=Pieris brassicae TaxID=7116 RepID=UPI001E65F40D|nr:uncharacterized protein LOC123718575 isoform X1 [Pieris brassicae]
MKTNVKRDIKLIELDTYANDLKDFSNQFDTKTDVCTCKRTRKIHEISENLSGTEIGVSSVKPLPKRRTRRIYARNTKDTGVGSSIVLQKKEISYYEHKKTSSKCVGVWESKIVPVLSKKLSPIIQTESHTTSPLDITKKNRNNSTQTVVKETKPNVDKLPEVAKAKVDKESSDSLVQHIHNLENPSFDKTSEDLIENKLEREYRKMFATDEGSDLKRASVRKRFESLRKGMSRNDSVKSVSRKDVSIASDPPSLEAKSYSNTKVYSPYTSYTQFKGTKQAEKSNSSTHIIESQSVRGMFKLWGKKFNLEEEKEKIPEKVVQIVVPSKSGKKSKFFCFNKRSKRDKKSVTANRCEVGLKVKMNSKHKIPDKCQNNAKGYLNSTKELVVELESESYSNEMRKSWLKKFLTNKVDSRQSVKLRWNNKMYSTSSSTVFELLDCVYKNTVIQSKSEISCSQNKFMPRTIEAWMIPQIITQMNPQAMNAQIVSPQVTTVDVIHKPFRKNIKVTYLDRKWYIDKSHRGNKIELVLHSKNLIESKSSDYILIDIPKGYFTDSMESSQSEEVFKITDYESPNSKPSILKRNLDTGDHVLIENDKKSILISSNDVSVPISDKESVQELPRGVINETMPSTDEEVEYSDYNHNECDRAVKGSGDTENEENDLKKDGEKENDSDNFNVNEDRQTEQSEQNLEQIGDTILDNNVAVIQENEHIHCDVIGVGIITQRDIRDIKKPILKIQDTDSDSAHNLPPPKKCEFAESYLQEYCRNWIPLGIDFFSWCVSDTQIKSDSHTSLNNQGDGSKSCPNMYEEPSTVVSSYNSSCSHCLALEEEPKRQNFLSKFFGKSDIASTEAQSISELKRFQPKDSIEVFKRRKIYSEGYNAKWNKLCPKPCITPAPESKPKKHVSIPECQPYEVVEQPCKKCFPGILNLSGSKPCKKKHKHTYVVPDPICAIPPKPVCSNICSKECCPPCVKDKGKNSRPCAGKSPPICGRCPPLTPSEIINLMRKFPDCPSLPQRCPLCNTAIMPQKCLKCCTLILPKKCPKCAAPVSPLKCAKCAKPIMQQTCPNCPSITVPIKCPRCTMELMPQKCPQCCSILVPQNCPRCTSQIIPSKCPMCSTIVQPPTCPKCCVPLPQKCPKCSPTQICPKCSSQIPPPKCGECRQEILPKKCSQCSSPVLPPTCPKCRSQTTPQICPKCSTKVISQKCPRCCPALQKCPQCSTQLPPPKCGECRQDILPKKCSQCSSPVLPPTCPKCRSQTTPQICPKCSTKVISQKCPRCCPASQKCPRCRTQLPPPKCGECRQEILPKKCSHCSSPVLPFVCPKCRTQTCPQICPKCSIEVLPKKCPKCSPQSPIKKILSTIFPPKCPICSSPLKPQNCPKCCTPIPPKLCPKCSIPIASPKCPNCNSSISSRCPKCSSPLPQSCPKCPAQCPKSCSPIRVQKCPKCFVPILTQKCPNCCSLLCPTTPSQTSLRGSQKSPSISQKPSTQSIPDFCNLSQANSPRPNSISGIKLAKPRSCPPCPHPTLNFPPQTSSKQSLNDCSNCVNQLQETPSSQELREGYNIKVQDEDGQTLYERIDYRSNKPQQYQNKICGDSYIHRVSTPSVVLNKVGLNENDSQKNSHENLLEINLTLKFKQGDKTEINVCNPDSQKEEKQDVIKAKEIFHMQDAKECIDTDKNDVNIKILIKNFTGNEEFKSKHIDKSSEQTEFSKNITNKFQTVSTGYSEFVLDQTMDEGICTDCINTEKSCVNIKKEQVLTVSSISFTEHTATDVSSIKNDVDFDFKTDISERDATEKSESVFTDEEKHENYFNETIKKLRSKREKKEMLKKLFEQSDVIDKEKVKSVRQTLQAILTDSDDSTDQRGLTLLKPYFRSDSLTNLYDFDNTIIEEKKSDILYPTKENSSDSETPKRCMCKTLAAKLNMDFPINPCCCRGCDKQDEEVSCDLQLVDVQTQDSRRRTYITNVSMVKKSFEVFDTETDFVDILQSEELKKAVLEIYAEKTATKEGTRYIARLPKLVFGND